MGAGSTTEGGYWGGEWSGRESVGRAQGRYDYRWLYVCRLCATMTLYHPLPVAQALQTTVALTSLVGDAIMVVATTPNPTLSSSSWSSQWLTGNMVQVLPGDVGACAPPCVYYIGVTGGPSSVAFTIVATGQAADPQVLSLGQPQVGKPRAVVADAGSAR